MAKPQETSSKWKIIAMVFIGLFVVENIVFIWAFFASEEDSRREAICITQYCTPDKFQGYNYNVDTHVCTCSNNNQIVEQHIIE